VSGESCEPTIQNLPRGKLRQKLYNIFLELLWFLV